MIKPGSFVFPSCGKQQRVTAFPHGVRSLERPDVLQKKRMLLHFELVANNISRIRGWNAQDLELRVRDQLATFSIGRDLDRVLLLDLVVLALGRNAPGMKTLDFLLSAETTVTLISEYNSTASVFSS